MNDNDHPERPFDETGGRNELDDFEQVSAVLEAAPFSNPALSENPVWLALVREFNERVGDVEKREAAVAREQAIWDGRLA